jgi:hypothetical protein
MMAMSWCARGTACDKNERTCALVSVRKVPKNQGMNVKVGYEIEDRKWLPMSCANAWCTSHWARPIYFSADFPARS